MLPRSIIIFFCIITSWTYMPPSIIILSNYNEVAFNTAFSFSTLFCFVFGFHTLWLCEFCAPRMSRRYSVLWSVFLLWSTYFYVMIPKRSTLHGHSAYSYIVIYMGGSYASGAQRLCKGLPTWNILLRIILLHCFTFVFVLVEQILSSSSSSSQKHDWLFVPGSCAIYELGSWAMVLHTDKTGLNA